MTEGRCEDCKSWNWIPSENPLCKFGACRSKDAVDAAGGMLMPTNNFGCPWWQEKGSDLREQLAEYTYETWRSWTQSRTRPYEELPKWHKDKCRADADRILAIVKDTFDATSS